LGPSQILERNLAEFEQANKMGRMTSVKLADGKPTDYSTENQSKYSGGHNTES